MSKKCLINILLRVTRVRKFLSCTFFSNTSSPVSLPLRKTFFLILSSIIATLFIPTSALAAGFDLINITTKPKTPGANESVTIRIESYAVNLNSANITWYINNEAIENGIADKDFVVTTGDFGEKTTVDILILTAEGSIIRKQVIIAPAEIDLLWEAQTYTPPFYKGKALPSYKSLVRVSAIPRVNSLTSNPKDFYYKWMYNNTQNVGEALAKTSVVIPMNYADSQIPIQVMVSLPETDWKGEKRLLIKGAVPKLVFYSNAPLLGMQFGRALTANNETDATEYGIFAAPYFFSLDNLMNNNLLYTWNINGRYQAPELNPQYMTFTKNGTAAQEYAVFLRIQNPKRILQEAGGKTGVYFTLEQ